MTSARRNPTPGIIARIGSIPEVLLHGAVLRLVFGDDHPTAKWCVPDRRVGSSNPFGMVPRPQRA
jgi:hypothetical protein